MPGPTRPDSVTPGWARCDNDDPISGGTNEAELSPCAGAAGMAGSVGSGGSDPPAAGAMEGPLLSIVVHATNWEGASVPEEPSAGAGVMVDMAGRGRVYG